jgi:hypothetical protein
MIALFVVEDHQGQLIVHVGQLPVHIQSASVWLNRAQMKSLPAALGSLHQEER